MAKYKTGQRYKDHDRLSAHAQNLVRVLTSSPQPFASPSGGSWPLGRCVGSLAFRFLLSAKSYVFSCDCSHCLVAHLVLRNENKQPVTVLTTETNKDI